MSHVARDYGDKVRAVRRNPTLKHDSTFSTKTYPTRCTPQTCIVTLGQGNAVVMVQAVDIPVALAAAVPVAQSVAEAKRVV